jgi:hypothetical protein
LFAPVSVLSGDQGSTPGGPSDDPAGELEGTVGTIAGLIGDALTGADGGGGSPQSSPGAVEGGQRPGETHTLLAPGASPDPTVQFTASGSNGGTAFASLLTAAARGTLPLTGAGLAAIVALGVALLSSGGALRRLA